MYTRFKEQKVANGFSRYIRISLAIALIVLLVQNISILLSAYSQETADSIGLGQSQQESNSTIKIIIFLIISYIIWTIYKRLKYRLVKYRKRQCFTACVKENALLKQHYKCAICKKRAGIWDYDHKDGNRSNNDPRNCQAVCPNCHAKKTRGLLRR
jgi:hypothetical protein